MVNRGRAEPIDTTATPDDRRTRPKMMVAAQNVLYGMAVFGHGKCRAHHD